MDAKRFVHEYLGTHPCVECGERRIPCLQFDHLRDKVETIANAVSRGWSVKRIEAEITKCQVLCANCHAVKTAAQLEWYTTY